MSWAKEFSAFWKCCGLWIRAKSKGKIMLMNSAQTYRAKRKRERKKKGQTDSVTESGHWGALRRRHSGQERSLGFPKHTFIQSLSQCRIKTLAPEHIVFERNTELPFHNRCTQLYCNPHNETLRNLFPSATHTYLKGFSWALLHS